MPRFNLMVKCAGSAAEVPDVIKLANIMHRFYAISSRPKKQPSVLSKVQLYVQAASRSSRRWRTSSTRGILSVRR